MTIGVSGHEHERWQGYGLKDFGQYAECVEYVNQSEYEDGQLEGDWYYVDDDVLTVEKGPDAGRYRVIYTGSFGNYNSPGATHYTEATLYDLDVPGDVAMFDEDVNEWADSPEYLPTDGDDE